MICIVAVSAEDSGGESSTKVVWGAELPYTGGTYMQGDLAVGISSIPRRTRRSGMYEG